MSHDTKKVPTCIGVILDGNRRWAKAQGLTTAEGHRAGFEKVKALTTWAKDAGIAHVIVYAFSTENWNRSPEEVSYLMALIEQVFRDEVDAIAGEDVRIRVIGERERFSPTLQKLFEEIETRTASRTAHTLTIALSYGGRTELVQAVHTLIAAGATSVTAEDIATHLWTKGIPDPDMIIRTSGEQRLSNFLPWQSVYSELFFTTTLWPDFSKDEFFAMLEQYATRERRRGT